MRVLRIVVVWSTAVVGFGFAGVLAAWGGEPSAAHGVRTGPAGVAFYRPPGSLPRVHGTPIWVRAAPRDVRLTAGARTWLVLYRSTSLNGRAIAVSGSISIPRGRPPRGGWPVVSWAPGTTGVAARCAATRIPASEAVSYVVPELNSWLRRGYAVVRTDYEGLGVPGERFSYLIGHSEARGVLDIVRAAGAIDARIGGRVVIAGHSQGGQAALFAAADAPHWTPELRLRGVVAFAPSNHLARGLRPVLAMTEPSAASAAVAAIFASMGQYASPRLRLRRVLTPRALALVPTLRTRCLAELSVPTSPWAKLAPADVLREGVVDELSGVLDAQNPALRIRVPVLLAYGLDDTTVLPAGVRLLIGELRARGDHVQGRGYPGVDHAGIVAAAAHDTLVWLNARLRGVGFSAR
jgi:pimeloyl-ACP methyl ester carboxylesterase